MVALESRLQATENEAKVLGQENETLKSSLAAKERDCKLSYKQYQRAASSLLEYKTKVTVTLDKLNTEVEQSSGEISILSSPESTNEGYAEMAQKFIEGDMSHV